MSLFLALFGPTRCPTCVRNAYQSGGPPTTLDLWVHALAMFQNSFAGLNGAISNRLVACYAADMDIEQRNRLRVEAYLPLLDVPTEMALLKKAEDDAEFEKYFKLRRPEFQHLWSDRSRGFLTNMGIYNAVRKALRQEMQQALSSRP